MTGSQGNDIGCEISCRAEIYQQPHKQSQQHKQQQQQQQSQIQQPSPPLVNNDTKSDGIAIQGDGKKHTVHWFRKGLRLHDNPSLRDGLAGASTFRCVFVLDPWFAGSANVSINKWRSVVIQTVYSHCSLRKSR